ncbi:hypothetical protein U8527_13370 [Kordia algicida OT-1]|uniref:WGR domain-containing protein n=1 Tax=Kordia algicida OT-1 TaxID=391587 RepID=A9E5N5_9FLAO|nr:hypothetical protein [Kordia algicida]EDP95202.1 hypothetical protein KAOT1_06952 [Kordia algicida OT-1]
MLKLYKTVNGKLHYWETWEDSRKTATIHWGIVGDEGEFKEITVGFFSSLQKSIQKLIDQKIKEGYHEFEDDAKTILEIVYTVDGFGSEADLDKRYLLEEKLDQILGWTGLGEVDGGSIGSGTMEVACLVVDAEIAKKVIQKELENTEFADYTQIQEMK